MVSTIFSSISCGEGRVHSVHAAFKKLLNIISGIYMYERQQNTLMFADEIQKAYTGQLAMTFETFPNPI